MFTQRAIEVSRDVFEAIDHALGQNERRIAFHLDGSDKILERDEAAEWVKASVDEGFPEIRFVIEQQSSDRVMINLAAFEDTDSAFYV
jgi:DNA polymerase III sliding clamp (beta) subunit (PCNA family)